MIFVVKGADFSAKNIGHVSVKTADEISERTIAALEFYGGTYTDDEKLAVDNFIEVIQKYSSKIMYAYLPILAVENQETLTRDDFSTKYLYNLATNNGAKVWNSAEFTISRKLIIGEHGISAIITSPQNLAPYILLDNAPNASDICVFFAGNFPSSDASNGNNKTNLYSSALRIQGDNNASVNSSLKFEPEIDKTIIGMSNGGNGRIMSVGKTYQESYKNDIAGIIDKVGCYRANSTGWTTDSNWNYQYSAFIIGTSLTKEEYVEINNALIDVIDALW